MKTHTRDYSNLTREELEARLNAAEDVCILFAWSPVGEGDRSAAAHEMWLVWEAIGGDSTREGNPHLTDELIRDLSEKRQATRRNTLDRLTAAMGEPADD